MVFASRTLARLVLAGCLALPAAAQDITFDAPGADEDLADRLRANALLLQEAEDGAGRTAQDIVAAARTDYARLTATLYEFGHFAPVVSITLDGREASGLSPFSVPASIATVAIEVEPGPVFSFGTAEIGPLAPGTDLPEDFRPGGAATTPVLQDTAAAAIDQWRARGHAVADVQSQRIVARHRDAALDASIVVAPGPVVTFGRLVPRGEDRMRTERITEIAGLPQGVVYSPEILARVTERLRDTGVFSAVALEERPLGPDNTMNIIANVAESPPRRFGAGAELSTDEGARVTAFWLHRNLFGGAERLRIDGEISGIGQEGIDTEEVEGIDAGLRARLSRPATFTPDTLAYGELSIIGLDEPTYRLAAIELEVGVERWFSTSLEGALGIGVRQVRFEDALGTRETTVLFLPGEITWDNRDDALNPTAGVYMVGTATPFLSLDDGTGIRLTADTRGYVGFGENDRTVLAGRAQLGVLAGGDYDTIPPDFLFFSGGSGTVRGQEYQSLGAVQQGIDSGGRGFAGLSAEIRQSLGDSNFGLVAFADAGFISPGADFQDGDWHAGAGVGLRYATPFGPVRVDIATPVRGNGVGEDLFLYIGIGQAF
ncbi:BamA/TamA family outer membrane protein [Roseibacterium sp. SDUM158017]|uniref:autotransporter assembly complex protein TamA n=1 Tax=Roseicyclus salinarum TaxID=3036773 RepID=UPI0024152625|nr:BamA/TamA family outer membrane protein [Roseibacterium sp. SDUM158017]MDG4646992.1 BamA/TamA family outer membrane protein [Roseibacterium sp. SDUM158017]